MGFFFFPPLLRQVNWHFKGWKVCSLRSALSRFPHCTGPCRWTAATSGQHLLGQAPGGRPVSPCLSVLGLLLRPGGCRRAACAALWGLVCASVWASGQGGPVGGEKSVVPGLVIAVTVNTR